ncbi:MAG: FtsX-like permease family protein, partial [Colwellia sp.]
KRIKVFNKDQQNEQWLTIVGVVESTIQGSREYRNLTTVFRPYTQLPTSNISIAIKMKASQGVVTKTLRKTLQSIDPHLPSFKIESYKQSNDRHTAPILFMSKLISVFALTAVFLAGTGIYGVMSNTIAQRTQEIGIKRALGADESTITREYLAAGIKQLLLGGIPGTLVGTAMGYAMAQNFGTGNAALAVIASTIVILITLIVIYATYVPTKKALELEPSGALHYQ